VIETFLIITIFVTIHYIGEWLKEYPDYSCPPYCEVDHNHIIDDKEVDADTFRKLGIHTDRDNDH
jgi:hypothetical protein